MYTVLSAEKTSPQSRAVTCAVHTNSHDVMPFYALTVALVANAGSTFSDTFLSCIRLIVPWLANAYVYIVKPSFYGTIDVCIVLED